jgi:hypothetical protein
MRLWPGFPAGRAANGAAASRTGRQACCASMSNGDKSAGQEGSLSEDSAPAAPAGPAAEEATLGLAG